MNPNIRMYNDSQIYVLCPANLRTGGTELLHQLVHSMNCSGRTAYITYYYEGKNADRKNPTPNEYEKYTCESKDMIDILDDEHNILVIPEVCVGKHRKFKRIQKLLWWLSVDNYLCSVGIINRLKRYGLASCIKHIFIDDYARDEDVFKYNLHLVQSHFAKDYINKIGIVDERIVFLSDYINDVFFKQDFQNERKDVVLYNPKKGREFTQKIIEFAPDIVFQAIDNMTTNEVVILMRSSKVYIDFGNHPGKDRIPREAAMCGCCVITSLNGSAKYHDDVPIPDSSKFEADESRLHQIVERIKECLCNYDSITREYDEYRNSISKEKEQFREAIKQIFF